MILERRKLVIWANNNIEANSNGFTRAVFSFNNSKMNEKLGSHSNLNQNASPLKGNSEFSALLIRIGQEEDKQAFLELFDYFAPRIKSYLLKGGLYEDEADELAQDTMLSVWEKATSFDASKAAASTWIFTIARNKRIDYFRKSGRMSTQPPENFNMLTSEDESPFEALYSKEVGGEVDEALKSLSEDQLNMIQKAFFEDKPHSEIAKETGLPLGTVKSRIRLAIDKLRKTIKSDTDKDKQQQGAQR